MCVYHEQASFPRFAAHEASNVSPMSHQLRLPTSLAVNVLISLPRGPEDVPVYGVATLDSGLGRFQERL